jgi:hypothetical protein
MSDNNLPAWPCAAIRAVFRTSVATPSCIGERIVLVFALRRPFGNVGRHLTLDVAHQTAPDPVPARLALTERGISWLAQFKAEHRDTAARLLSALTLVSHSAFERGMLGLIELRAAAFDGPIGLFAMREVKPTVGYFVQARNTIEPEDRGDINAVGPGKELGSETRIAALIRNLARGCPEKFLNHPSLAEMQSAKVRGIFVVDDLLGSGHRAKEFLQSIWQHETIRSWHSLHLIQFEVITYSATNLGKATAQKAKGRPIVWVERDCPTFLEIPWQKTIHAEILALCREYGQRTSIPWMALGYQRGMVALVFEHGCPDNVPAILWAPTDAKSDWRPLFPDRSVMSGEASAFPPEIIRRDPNIVLAQAGQENLAASGALSRRGPIGETILLMLALTAKGIRRRSALTYATGVSAQDCSRRLDLCVRWGFLTRTLRLTQAGKAELDYARKLAPFEEAVPPKGEEAYYPAQLRGPRGG